MTSRKPLPNSLRRALARIDLLVDQHPALVLDDDASVLAGYLGYCRDELLYAPQTLRQQYYYLAYAQRWFRATDHTFPAVTSAEDILAFLAFQRDERGNSLVNLRHYLSVFRQLFGWLAREGVVAVDPTLTIVLRTPSIRNVHDVLDRGELLRFLEAARADREDAPPRFRLARVRDTALISMIAGTGCRLSEALGLIRERVDLDAGVVFLPGKGDYHHAVKERVAPLVDPDILDDLRRWFAVLPTPPDSPIFTTPSGSIVEPTSVNMRFRRVAGRADLTRRVTPHGLRATFASLLVANGVDPVTLQQLMGHAHLSTTLTLYARLDTRSLHDAWRRHNPLAGGVDE